MSAFRPIPSDALRRGLLALVAVALLHAQSLGLLHRLVHAGTAQAASVGALHAAGFAQAAGWLAHDASEADCRLFDGLLASAPAGGSPDVVHLAASLPAPAFQAARFLPAHRTPFQARGPPARS